MKRNATRRLFATLLGALLALALVGVAGAGGWAVVILDRESALIGIDQPLTAGTGAQVGFTVLQHGKTPMEGLTPIITATNEATGETATFTAQAEGASGHYVVELRLPAAGTWRWQVDAFGPISVMAPLTVVAPAPATSPARIPTALPWAALAAAVVVGGALLTLRVRRRPATV